MSSPKQYTYDEVKKSSDQNRTVIAIHDKVYDVTEFLNEHPGGEEVLLDHGGKDATEDFNDVGHSSDAQELMKKYLVGEIVEAERRNVAKKPNSVYKTVDKPDEKYVQGPGTPFMALAGAVVVLAVLFYFYVL